MRKETIAGIVAATVIWLWAAYYFRYEPIPHEGGGILVWDRLTGQACIAPSPSSPRRDIYCSPADYAAAQRQQREQQQREQEQREQEQRELEQLREQERQHPALEGAEGVIARKKLLDNGFTPEEVDKWQLHAMQEQLHNGWAPKDIDAYWGKAAPDKQ